MSEVKQLHEQLQKDYAALSEAVKNGHKELADKIAAGITEQNSRIEKIEAAVARSAAVEGLKEKLEETKSRDAFRTFARTGNDSELRAIETRAGSKGSNADGAFAVPTVVESTIGRLLTETSDVRAVANVLSIGNASYEKNISLANAGAGWVAETAARTETQNPQLARISITAHEIYAEPKATQILIEDANFDVESWYVNEVVDAFQRLENAAFVNGDGDGKPFGFLSYTRNDLASNAADLTKLNFFQSATAKAVTYADLNKLVYALAPQARAAGKWVMSKFWLQKVMTLTYPNTDFPAWRPALQAGQPSTLLGYPVHEFADMPNTDTATPGSPLIDPVGIVFGDFKRAYTIVDRVGVTVQRDSITEKQYVKFYTRKRVGAGREDLKSIVAMTVKQS